MYFVSTLLWPPTLSPALIIINPIAPILGSRRQRTHQLEWVYHVPLLKSWQTYHPWDVLHSICLLDGYSSDRKPYGSGCVCALSLSVYLCEFEYYFCHSLQSLLHLCCCLPMGYKIMDKPNKALMVLRKMRPPESEFAILTASFLCNCDLKLGSCA